jgi:pyroglutamyl-peptidase
MARLLLSSFGPFGPHAVNASAEVARRLWEEGLPGADLVAVELPVVRHEASRLLVDAFERVRPDAAVMLGIAESRQAITPERVAINLDDYRIPDNAGNQPADEPVVSGAPAAYFATLPVRRIVAALSAADIPAEISNSAGTYLCNHVSYALLHHIERTGAPCRAGFVHLPTSLPLATLVRGVTIAAETVLDSL